jgi:hypothetical protein
LSRAEILHAPPQTLVVHIEFYVLRLYKSLLFFSLPIFPFNYILVHPLSQNTHVHDPSNTQTL